MEDSKVSLKDKIKNLFKNIILVVVFIGCCISLVILNYHRQTDVNITETYKLSYSFKEVLDEYIAEANYYNYDNEDDSSLLSESQKLLKQLNEGYSMRYNKYNFKNKNKVIIEALDDRIKRLEKLRNKLEITVSKDIKDDSINKYIYQSEDKTILIIDKNINSLRKVKVAVMSKNKGYDSYSQYSKSLSELKDISTTTYLYE